MIEKIEAWVGYRLILPTIREKGREKRNFVFNHGTIGRNVLSQKTIEKILGCQECPLNNEGRVLNINHILGSMGRPTETSVSCDTLEDGNFPPCNRKGGKTTFVRCKNNNFAFLNKEPDNSLVN